ncbi:MAG: CopG family ribbon-helix-helix protein [Stellaceae bacterium]
MEADAETVTVQLDRSLKEKFEALARRTRRSKSELVAEAIAAYVDLDEWQTAEIKTGLAELEEGRILSQKEAEERYRQLLQRR